MIDRLKELLAEYKVTVSFVAGALVVGTAWGSCSFEPSTEVVSATTVESAEETVVDLFIVYEILCIKDGDEMIGEGGKIKIIENWKAEENQLTALTYDYEISI